MHGRVGMNDWGPLERSDGLEAVLLLRCAVSLEPAGPCPALLYSFALMVRVLNLLGTDGVLCIALHSMRGWDAVRCGRGPMTGLLLLVVLELIAERWGAEAGQPMYGS